MDYAGNNVSITLKNIADAQQSLSVNNGDRTVKTSNKISCVRPLHQQLGQLYFGMFAGLITLAAIASCIGLAGNLFEVVNVMLLALTATVLLSATDRLLNSQ